MQRTTGSLAPPPSRPRSGPKRSRHPIANFEGLSNQDNFNIFGFRVNPPDPVGDVGPNHYVEMINLVFARVLEDRRTYCSARSTPARCGPASPIDDCTDPSGDPIVVYDQLADRWMLTQFTTRGLDSPTRRRPLLQLRRHLHDRRPDRFVLPVRVHHAAGHEDGGTSSPTTRSTACGPTPTS